MMKLYNTMSRQVETLKPLDPNEISIYSCGPTVYSEPHIGNWSAYIYWDVLVRALKLDGYKVKRVINLTDVGHLVSDADEGEDKLAKKASQEKVTAWQIAERYITSFMNGYTDLGLLKPTFFARASDFVKQQLELIRQLKKLGLTYQINDGIYLDTSKIKDYGKLARLDLGGLKAGARVEFNIAKKNLSDFAVWKFSNGAKRDMEWATPKDLLDDPTEDKPGFPGWHIECSAIILELLGPQIDIHTGGIDHIPIHHTNEIAQMSPITKSNVAQFWLHNHHLMADGKKISKSLGNGYTLGDLAERGFSPMEFKMLILQGHFQTESNFSFVNLEAAAKRLNRWRKMADLRHQLYQNSETRQLDFLAAKHHLIELISNNLNTPQALAAVDQIFSQAEKLDLEQIDRRSLLELLELIDELLGLDLIEQASDINDEQKRLIKARDFARASKNYQQADLIRQQLLNQKIALDDRAEHSIWYHLR